jgi:hypothetical protein
MVAACVPASVVRQNPSRVLSFKFSHLCIAFTLFGVNFWGSAEDTKRWPYFGRYVLMGRLEFLAGKLENG